MQHLTWFMKWLAENDGLAAWGQLTAAVVTLAATYFTVFIPIWTARKSEKSRHEKLKSHGIHLLVAGAAAVAEFCNSTRNKRFFLTIEGQLFGMKSALSQIQRFPLSELEDPLTEGSLSDRLIDIEQLLEATIILVPSFINAIDKSRQDGPEELDRMLTELSTGSRDVWDRRRDQAYKLTQF